MSHTATLPPSADSAIEHPPHRWIVYALLIIISAGIAGTGILTNAPHLSANDRSRWSTVWSLVERGTYQIDEIDANPKWQTIDKVRHEGHFYSTKPALLPTMIAGVYWVVKKTTGLNMLDNTTAVVRIILLLINWIPMIIALVLLARLLDRHAKRMSTRLFILTTAGTATFLTTFQVTLNNHNIAASCVILTLYFVIKIVVDEKTSPLNFLSAGFFAMLTCTNELPAALFGLVIFIVLFWQHKKRTLLFFAPAAILPLAGFFITTYLSTGGWKPFYMYYGTEKYKFIYEGIPSYWMRPGGIDANQEHPLRYAMHCLVGHRGIFSLSPIFLLTVAAWVMLKRWKGDKLRLFYGMGLGLTVVVFSFYMTRTSNYNYGGNTCGLRWMFWLIPFWLLAMIPIFDNWGNKRGVQIVTTLLLFVSMFSALSPMKNPWRPPWLYNLMADWKWIDYRIPHPALVPKLTTWFRTLPELKEGKPTAWVEFRGTTATGTIERLRLTDLGRSTIKDRLIRTVESKRISYIGIGRKEIELASTTMQFKIDEKLFNAGKVPKEFLVFDGASKKEQETAINALRGLPARKTYNSGAMRYLKTTLQKDAFTCQQAAAQVRYHSNPLKWKEISRYRRDLWLCQEIPFGLLKTRVTISHDITKQVVSIQDFIAVDWQGRVQP